MHISYDAVENGAHFVLDCPFITSLDISFSSLFENVALGSFKSFFKCTIKLTLASISRRLMHFATLEN